MKKLKFCLFSFFLKRDLRFVSGILDTLESIAITSTDMLGSVHITNTGMLGYIPLSNTGMLESIPI